MDNGWVLINGVETYLPIATPLKHHIL